MKQVFLRQQSGVSLFGLITMLILIGFVGLLAAQVLPTYSEYRSICTAIAKAKEVGGSVREIQMSFNKAAEVNYIESLKAADLEITKENGVFEVSFAYDKKIHIAGPLNLLMEYKGSTAPEAPPGTVKKPKE